MKFNMKRFLLILVVFLLGTNIAVVWVYQKHLKSEIQTATPANGAAENSMNLTANLNLDANQHNQFRDFRRAYNRKANRTFSDMHQIRTQMANELSQTNPNSEKFEQLARQLGEKHYDLKKLTFEYYTNMQQILSPEQQQILANHFRTLLNGEGNINTPRQGQGPGNGQGRRRGWATEQTDSLNSSN
jgi:Spy/CpxP family protein refolding chaperone